MIPIPFTQCRVNPHVRLWQYIHVIHTYIHTYILVHTCTGCGKNNFCPQTPTSCVGGLGFWVALLALGDLYYSIVDHFFEFLIFGRVTREYVPCSCPPHMLCTTLNMGKRKTKHRVQVVELCGSDLLYMQRRTFTNFLPIRIFRFGFLST